MIWIILLALAAYVSIGLILWLFCARGKYGFVAFEPLIALYIIFLYPHSLYMFFRRR